MINISWTISAAKFYFLDPSTSNTPRHYPKFKIFSYKSRILFGAFFGAWWTGHTSLHQLLMVKLIKKFSISTLERKIKYAPYSWVKLKAKAKNTDAVKWCIAAALRGLFQEVFSFRKHGLDTCWCDYVGFIGFIYLNLLHDCVQVLPDMANVVNYHLVGDCEPMLNWNQHLKTYLWKYLYNGV